MKFAIAILAIFAAAIALPFCALQTLRKAWREGSSKESASKLRGGAFAKILLLHENPTTPSNAKISIADSAKLFREHFNAAENCIFLSRETYHGRSLAALANAALQVGIALAHTENAKPFRRLEIWQTSLRILTNAAPIFLILLLLHPSSWRAIPALCIVLLLLAAVQLLTFPAMRNAAERARNLTLKHELLPPAEIPEFSKLLRKFSQRHLAAPILDSFWLRWLFLPKK